MRWWWMSSKGKKEELYLLVIVLHQVRAVFWHNPWSGAVPHVSTRMKRSNLQKRDKTYSRLGCAGERIYLRCRQVIRKVPKPWKIFLFDSFAVVMGHFDMVRWKYDTVCIFSMLRDTLGLILWNKTDKKCKDQKKRSIFLPKSALIGKSIFQTQWINAVHGRCSSSSVLRDVPSNFTRSVKRRIVL